MKFAKKMDGMSSNVLQILDAKQKELATKGMEIINLSAGTPDFPPPKHVIDAMVEACKDPNNYKYALADLPELLDAVIAWYQRRYGVTLQRNEITSMYGSQEGMAHIAFPLCDPGDIVLTPDPGYPVFSFGPSMSGAQIVRIPLYKKNDFLINFDDIDPDLADKAKMMVVSYPNNPVTTKAPREFYIKLVEFAKKHDIIVLHDNAYSELVYDSEPGISFLSIPGAKDVGIEFNSLSKSYNMTGCRISFAVGNAEIIEKFKTFRTQIDYGIFLPIQYAAIAALTGPQDDLNQMRSAYKARRDALCQGLRDIGWQVPDAVSTMFAWFPLPKGYTDSTAFTFELLEKTGVVCVPGASFGDLGEGFVRMALIQPVDVLKKAVQKIAESGMIQA